MSSSDRRAVLAGLGVLALSGCFRPMLAEDTAARSLRHRIALPAVEGRLGYYLVRTLEDRLGEPHEPDFRLVVVTTLTDKGLAVTPNNAVTRITLLAQASWSVWRAGGAKPLVSDVAFSQSGYNATTSLFATRQARLDIEQRLARDLAGRIARGIFARADELTA